MLFLLSSQLGDNASCTEKSYLKKRIYVLVKVVFYFSQDRLIRMYLTNIHERFKTKIKHLQLSSDFIANNR